MLSRFAALFDISAKDGDERRPKKPKDGDDCSPKKERSFIMNEKKNKMSENVTSKEIAGGSATPIRKFSAYVSETVARVIPLDGPNMGVPEYQTVLNDRRVPQLIGQLQSANTEINRLKAELQKYQASGKVLNTAYNITRDENCVEGVNVYRINLNDEFKNICDGIGYLEGQVRFLLAKHIGKDFLNDMTAHLAQICFEVSHEEVMAKINRIGDATDSVTVGIRTIRELIGAFERAVSAISPKYPSTEWYAAKMKQLASSMNLKAFEMFLVCFPGEIITDASIYRDLAANRDFSDKLSQFQLELQFSAEMFCAYPLVLAKPSEYLTGFMTSVKAGDDIAKAVRAFRSGIPVGGMPTAIDKAETPLDDPSCDVLELCLENGADGVSAKAMMEHIKEGSKSRFQKTTLKLLRDRRYLEFACKDAHSSLQRYRITPDGATALRQARPGRTYSAPNGTDPESVPTAPNGKTE